MGHASRMGRDHRAHLWDPKRDQHLRDPVYTQPISIGSLGVSIRRTSYPSRARIGSWPLFSLPMGWEAQATKDSPNLEIKTGLHNPPGGIGGKRIGFDSQNVVAREPILDFW